ncbi:MAG: DUF2461 domain-containing protein [Paludibacteraceae bacterium]|nr:DUF2461 domain-containing protein [Paludibacteraceae bacterium]
MDTHNIVRFLTELSENNHKTWFDQNRSWYQDVKADFFDFTQQLIARVSEFDLRCAGLTVSDCTYRINRDIRFSADKRPYKTHMGAFVCPKGKKSGYGGYYFHIEPTGQEYLNSHLLAIGAYCPNKEELQSIREEIFDNTADFKRNMAQAKGFALDSYDKLKKAPAGFPADFADIDLLKHKSYCLVKPLTGKMLQSEHLLDEVCEQFKLGHAFNEQLNRAIAYAHNEE